MERLLRMGGFLKALGTFYQSSIGKKIVVAVTGIVLLLFVFVHMAGNLLIYAGRDALNSYGEFLRHFLHGWAVWIARFGLLAAVVLHVVATIQLTLRNRAARDTRYAFKDTIQASRSSRIMIVSGLVVFAFVVYHLLHFTITPGPQDPGYLDEVFRAETGGARHDVYGMVVTGFSNWIVSGVYIIAIALLCSHLSHGFSSVFQTLGIRTDRTGPFIAKAGHAYALLILIGNCSIPVAVLLGLTK